MWGNLKNRTLAADVIVVPVRRNYQLYSIYCIVLQIAEVMKGDRPAGRLRNTGIHDTPLILPQVKQDTLAPPRSEYRNLQFFRSWRG